jgi:hypothetical protein
LENERLQLLNHQIPCSCMKSGGVHKEQSGWFLNRWQRIGPTKVTQIRASRSVQKLLCRSKHGGIIKRQRWFGVTMQRRRSFVLVRSFC